MQGYKNVLRDGREIYVPFWPVDISIENLSKVGKILGTEEIVKIAEKNIAAVILALAESDDHKNAAGIVKHFVCCARIDGDKIATGEYSEKYIGNLKLVAEVFAEVMHAQYHDFFVSGLAEANSQRNTEGMIPEV